MNKKIYSWLIALSMPVLASVITACGGDNQSKVSENDTNTNEIVEDVAYLPSYNSHDLAFHDLYGNVKECTFIDNEWSSYNNSSTYRFNENGEWTNIPDFKEYEKSSWPELQGHKRYEKNAEGYIDTEWLTSDMEGVKKTSYEWENDRIVKRIGDGYAGVISYIYDDNGLLTSKKIKYGNELEDSQFSFVIYSYSDHEFDEHNNWLKRKVSKTDQTIDNIGNNTQNEKTYYEERKLSYFD